MIATGCGLLLMDYRQQALGWCLKNIMNDSVKHIIGAREKSWEKFGKNITFYIPGMIKFHSISGKYPAISITGDYCALKCDHCGGELLKFMNWATKAENLVDKCVRIYEQKNLGVLISGGCDEFGHLPWSRFIHAIWEIKKKTDLYISVHSGLIDYSTALDLKSAGVDQVLIDVIGDDETFQRVYHVPFGISRIVSTIEALQKAELEIVPHIVCGLFYGEIKGEEKAIEIISCYDVKQIVIVSVMNISKTTRSRFKLPSAEAIAGIIAKSRIALPDASLSLGCARERGNRLIETLAIDAGINKMALPSDEAVEQAEKYGLDISYQDTCCSVSKDFKYRKL